MASFESLRSILDMDFQQLRTAEWLPGFQYRARCADIEFITMLLEKFHVFFVQFNIENPPNPLDIETYRELMFRIIDKANPVELNHLLPSQGAIALNKGFSAGEHDVFKMKNLADFTKNMPYWYGSDRFNLLGIDQPPHYLVVMRRLNEWQLLVDNPNSNQSRITFFPRALAPNQLTSLARRLQELRRELNLVPMGDEDPTPNTTH